MLYLRVTSDLRYNALRWKRSVVSWMNGSGISTSFMLSRYCSFMITLRIWGISKAIISENETDQEDRVCSSRCKY